MINFNVTPLDCREKACSGRVNEILEILPVRRGVEPGQQGRTAMRRLSCQANRLSASCLKWSAGVKVGLICCAPVNPNGPSGKSSPLSRPDRDMKRAPVNLTAHLAANPIGSDQIGNNSGHVAAQIKIEIEIEREISLPGETRWPRSLCRAARNERAAAPPTACSHISVSSTSF